MFPQDFPSPQSYPGGFTPDVDNLATATNPLVPLIYEDNIQMGNIVYEFLAHEADPTFGQHSVSLGYPPLYEDTYDATSLLSPTSSYTGYATSPDTMNDILAFSPSPKPSQTSSTHASPEPSATPEPGCCQATPVFSQLRDKWCCSACNKDFRGKWECQRHIKTAGKRSKCVACGRNLSARDDSLLRHFTIHCKGNVSNLRLEDAFTSV